MKNKIEFKQIDKLKFHFSFTFRSKKILLENILDKSWQFPFRTIDRSD